MNTLPGMGGDVNIGLSAYPSSVISQTDAMEILYSPKNMGEKENSKEQEKLHQAMIPKYASETPLIEAGRAKTKPILGVISDVGDNDTVDVARSPRSSSKAAGSSSNSPRRNSKKEKREGKEEKEKREKREGKEEKEKREKRENLAI